MYSFASFPINLPQFTQARHEFRNFHFPTPVFVEPRKDRVELGGPASHPGEAVHFGVNVREQLLRYHVFFM